MFVTPPKAETTMVILFLLFFIISEIQSIEFVFATDVPPNFKTFINIEYFN